MTLSSRALFVFAALVPIAAAVMPTVSAGPRFFPGCPSILDPAGADFGPEFIPPRGLWRAMQPAMRARYCAAIEPIVREGGGEC